MKMKQPTLSLEKIRKRMSPFQKELFQEIWQHFHENGEWPTLRELYSTHGKQNVVKALKMMGTGVGHEETSGTRWPRYKLSLLGVLLTNDGKHLQKLLIRFLSFQRELFSKEPKRDNLLSNDIQTALELESEETALLGELLWLGSFGGSRGGPNNEWSTSAMEEAADFPKSGDLSPQLDKWVCKYYQPYNANPQNQQKQFAPEYFGNILAPERKEVTDQSQLSEIAMSLGRLRKKYNDPTKLGFLIMRFGGGKPFKRIVEVIKKTAEEHGLAVIRADENEFHAHLWENVRTLLHGCGFGIAIYERIDRDEPNANVGLEVGYLMAMNKPVLLLKDKTVTALQSDLAGKLYRNFDPHEPEKTIPQQLTKWLEDNGIIVSKQSQSEEL
jgi:hypothetical protein